MWSRGAEGGEQLVETLDRYGVDIRASGIDRIMDQTKKKVNPGQSKTAKPEGAELKKPDGAADSLDQTKKTKAHLPNISVYWLQWHHRRERDVRGSPRRSPESRVLPPPKLSGRGGRRAQSCSL